MNTKLTLAGLILISFVSVGYTGQVPALTQMVSGQTASAADVNDNFNNIATEVDDNDLRLDNHENDAVLHSDTLNGLACTTDQIAKFNGTSWVCVNDNSDTTAPVLTLTAPATSVTTQETVSIVITDDTEIAYYAITNPAPLSPGTASKAEFYTPGPGTTSLDIDYVFNLLDGYNKMLVTAVDRSGNSTADTVVINSDHCINLVPGADLRNCNFNGANLSNLDLTGVDLDHSFLNNANLTSTNLTDANLGEAVFESATLDNAIFVHTYSEAGSFANASLVGADFDGSVIIQSSMSNAVMDNAIFTDVVFDNVNLSDTSMTGIDLTGSAFHSSSLLGSNLTYDSAISVTIWGFMTICPNADYSQLVGDTCVNSLL